eukprot:5936337-Pleurochrysis_carterae.AAC.1
MNGARRGLSRIPQSGASTTRPARSPHPTPPVSRARVPTRRSVSHFRSVPRAPCHRRSKKRKRQEVASAPASPDP